MTSKEEDLQKIEEMLSELIEHEQDRPTRVRAALALGLLHKIKGRDSNEAIAQKIWSLNNKVFKFISELEGQEMRAMESHGEPWLRPAGSQSCLSWTRYRIRSSNIR